MLTNVRKFQKDGHICQIPQVPEELFMFAPSDSFTTRIKRFIIRMKMASSYHAGGWRYLASHAAIMHEHKRHLKHLHIIHPYSTFRMYWETYMIFIYASQFVVIPLELATYYTEVRQQIWKYWFCIRAMLDIVCLVDIVLHFFTGYMRKSRKEVVLDPGKIARHYCRTLFIPDLVSTIMHYTEASMLVIEIPYIVIHALKCFALLRFCRMVTFFEYCRNLGQQLKSNFAAYNIIMVVFCYVFFVHLITCTSIFIDTHKAKFSVKEHYRWRYARSPPDFFDNYCVNLFRAVIMINTINYGLDPLTAVTRIYIAFTWIVSKIITIFIIVYIMKVVVTRRSANIKYMENIRQIQEYMRHKKLSETLQKRILYYYEFRFQKNFYRESDILNSVTGALKEEVILHRCRKLVENVDFLNQLPPYLLVKIVGYLKYELFMVNDVIFRYNTPGYCMYFILTGSVAIYTQQGNEVAHLTDGAYFGEIAMLIPINRFASVISAEICELYRLDRKDFNRVIAPHRNLMKRLQKIAETRLAQTDIMMKKIQEHVEVSFEDATKFIDV